MLEARIHLKSSLVKSIIIAENNHFAIASVSPEVIVNVVSKMYVIIQFFFNVIAFMMIAIAVIGVH